jgi:Undecaprenyl-phosphate glucose phosphotransferase
MSEQVETAAKPFSSEASARPEKVANIEQAKRGFLPPISANTAAAMLVISDTLALLFTGFFLYDRIVVYSPLQNYYWTAIAFIWLVTLSILNFGRLYRYEVAVNPIAHFKLFVVVVGTAFLFLLATAFSINFTEDLSRRWVAYFALSSTTLVIANRYLISAYLRRTLLRQASKRNIAVVGTGEQASRLLSAIEQSQMHPIAISGVFDPAAKAGATTSLPGFSESVERHLKPGGIDGLRQSAREGFIDDVIIALPWSQDAQVVSLMDEIRELPVNIYLASDLVGFRAEFKSPPSHFGRLPVLQVVGKPMAGWDAIIKAIEDLVLAIVIFICVAPFMALIAVLVKLDSPGPALFKQKRVGFNNQIFDVYKFRSMHHQQQAPQQTQQAKKGDPRVTRLGRFLRRSSLDELPQIFNVLNGTMSVVGPRPHPLTQNEEFSRRTKNYFARHRVKPGITGLAQVKGYRGETDTTEKLEGRIRNDNFYAENWSLSLDVWILLRTFVITLSGKNAY